MMRSLLVALVFALGCVAPAPPTPLPPEPPDYMPPVPPGPLPVPDPAAPARYPETCAGACGAGAELCLFDGGDQCQRACQVREDACVRAPALCWNPSCMVRAADCAAWEACRGARP